MKLFLKSAKASTKDHEGPARSKNKKGNAFWVPRTTAITTSMHLMLLFA